MKIENKEMLLYSMKKAYDELYNVMNSMETEDQEVYFRLGSCLHWIADCYDRIKDFDIVEQDELFFKAVKAANNAQKHKKELWKLHRVSGSGYPRRYAKHYGVKYTWESIENVLLRHQNEKRAYEKLFYGENILKTLSDTKELVEKYFERCDADA